MSEEKLYPMVKVLVCGDRNWTDRDAIRQELSRLPRGSTIIHGAARGADYLAGQVAKELGFEVRPSPAKWHKYGKVAGPIRNQRMLKECLDLVLAFHRDINESRGTADMIRRARSAGVEVKIIKG